MVGPSLLRSCAGNGTAAERRRRQWLSRERRRDRLLERCDARFTRANRPRKAWSRRSIRSMRSAKPAQPSFSPRSMKAGWGDADRFRVSLSSRADDFVVRSCLVATGRARHGTNHAHTPCTPQKHPPANIVASEVSCLGVSSTEGCGTATALSARDGVKIAASPTANNAITPELAQSGQPIADNYRWSMLRVSY